MLWLKDRFHFRIQIETNQHPDIKGINFKKQLSSPARTSLTSYVVIKPRLLTQQPTQTKGKPDFAFLFHFHYFRIEKSEQWSGILIRRNWKVKIIVTRSDFGFEIVVRYLDWFSFKFNGCEFLISSFMWAERALLWKGAKYVEESTRLWVLTLSTGISTTVKAMTTPPFCAKPRYLFLLDKVSYFHTHVKRRKVNFKLSQSNFLYLSWSIGI